MKLIKTFFVMITFLCLLQPGSVLGQEEVATTLANSNELKTLLTFPKINTVGIYAVPEYQFGSLAGQFTSMGGGSVMVSLNKKLSLGVSGYSNFTNFSPSQISEDPSLQLRAEFGGGKLEYTLNPNSPVHVSFPLLIGGGHASVDSAGSHGMEARHQYSYDDHHHTHGNEISFLVIQPGINVEVNLFPFMKIFAGTSYRIVSGGESITTNTAIESPWLGQLHGLSFSAGIKIGYDFQMGKNHRK